MDQDTIITNSAATTINAPATKVWEALTKPDLRKRWFFGVDTLTDWQVGGPIVHKGEWNGKPYEDKGNVLKFEPPRQLAHTHWSSMSGRPDRPENYEEVSFSLVERGGKTELTMNEKNLPSEEARATSAKTWKGALEALKRQVEG